jgi:hypothetical protein
MAASCESQEACVTAINLSPGTVKVIEPFAVDVVPKTAQRAASGHYLFGTKPQNAYQIGRR